MIPSKFLYTAVLLLCLFSLSGCSGNFQLVKHGDNVVKAGWHEFIPYEPENAIERAVIETATTGVKSDIDDCEVYLIYQEMNARYVEVVGKIGDSDPWSVARPITRYRVLGEKIAGNTDMTYEIFPNTDFEKTVVDVAFKANSPDPVVLYLHNEHPMTMSSKPMGNCAAEVSIFSGLTPGKAPIAKKIIRFCFSGR